MDCNNETGNLTLWLLNLTCGSFQMSVATAFISSFLASAYINNDEKIISEKENNHEKSFTHPPTK
jgi:hypothetical protein